MFFYSVLVVQAKINKRTEFLNENQPLFILSVPDSRYRLE